MSSQSVPSGRINDEAADGHAKMLDYLQQMLKEARPSIRSIGGLLRSRVHDTDLIASKGDRGGSEMHTNLSTLFYTLIFLCVNGSLKMLKEVRMRRHVRP